MIQSATERDFVDVALIDDHALFRHALRRAFLYHGKIKISVEAATYSELLEKLSISPIEIIIMDLDMPDLNKTKVTIARIQELIPESKILILTMHDDRDIELELIKCGIYAFVSKGADFERLIDCILTAADMVPPARRLKNVIFSERERIILKLIALGKTNSEISKVVFLSVRSIEEIRRNMKDRANVPNTASLIDFAVRNRMIE